MLSYMGVTAAAAIAMVDSVLDAAFGRHAAFRLRRILIRRSFVFNIQIK